MERVSGVLMLVSITRVIVTFVRCSSLLIIGSCLGKPHFWSEMIEDHLFFITVVDNLRRYPLFVTLGRWILPLTASLRDKHTGLSREKVAR